MQVALTVEWQVRTEDIIPWTGDADMVSGGWPWPWPWLWRCIGCEEC